MTKRTLPFTADPRALKGSLPEPSALALERRRTIRLENYWLSLRWSNRGPFFQDFRPERNPVPWADLFLAHRAGPGEEFRFEHVGDGLAAALRPPGTNLPQQDWLPEAIARHCGDMLATLERGRPERREGNLVLPDGAEIRYRSVLLPFVDNAREPRYVLGALTCRTERPSALVLPWRRSIAPVRG